VKRRMMGIIAALALALVGTVILVSYVQGAEDRALAGEKVVKVLVAAEAIDAGTSAEELEGKLEFERVPQKVKAEGAITSISQLGNRVTETDLLEGEQIVRARFVEPSRASRTPGAQEGETLLQETVALEPERAMGGVVKAGDSVAVVASFDPFDLPDGTKTANQTHILLHKVRVTNVQIASGGGGTSEEESGDESPGAQSAAPEGRFLVTLALTAPDVERVTFTAEFGHVWLSAEPQDADTGGTKIVGLDNVFA
jgi:pilus assembly protein CpaB